MPVPHFGMMMCLGREVTCISEYQVLYHSVELSSCNVCLDQKQLFCLSHNNHEDFEI